MKRAVVLGQSKMMMMVWAIGIASLGDVGVNRAHARLSLNCCDCHGIGRGIALLELWLKHRLMICNNEGYGLRIVCRSMVELQWNCRLRIDVMMCELGDFHSCSGWKW